MDERDSGRCLEAIAMVSGVILVTLTGVLALGSGANAFGTEGPGRPDRSGVGHDPAPPGVWVEGESLVMDTRLFVRLRAPGRDAGLRWIHEASGVARQHERILSSWSNESDLSRVNHAPVDRWVPMSYELSNLLQEAERWSVETHGAFLPSVGALVDAWDLRGSGRVPDPRELELALRAMGPAAVELDPRGLRARRRSESTWIDTGGFGKGAALRAMTRTLVERGVIDALIDFGGQIVALGSPTGDGRGWPVTVAHPDHRFQPARPLLVSDVSVATSGSSERSLRVGQASFSHVLDPRSGQPVAHWGSATVASRDPLVADAVATAMLVMGPVEGLQWARRRADVGVHFSVLEADGVVREFWNDTMETWLEPRVERVARSTPGGASRGP